MKKVTINSINSLGDGKSIKIELPSLLNGTKIVNAILKAKISSTMYGSFQVNYSIHKENTEKLDGWNNVDTIDLASEGYCEINISDEIQNALDKKSAYVRLDFIGLDGASLTFSEIALETSYVMLSHYQGNGTAHSLDLGRAGQASVDISTGKLAISKPLVTSDNNVLPLSISANYNMAKTSKMPEIGMAKNWSLNLSQFLIKDESEESLSFTYLDQNGQEQIIEERYYYIDENGKQEYKNRSELKVDMDGNLVFELESGAAKAILTELIAPSGFKLASSISDIAGAKLVDYEPDELANVRNQMEQIKLQTQNYEDSYNANNEQIAVLSLTKEFLNKQINAQLNNMPKNEKYLELRQKLETIKKFYTEFTRSFKSLDPDNKGSELDYAKAILENKQITENMIVDIFNYYTQNAPVYVPGTTNALTIHDIRVLAKILTAESPYVYSFGGEGANVFTGTLAMENGDITLQKEVYTDIISESRLKSFIQEELKAYLDKDAAIDFKDNQSEMIENAYVFNLKEVETFFNASDSLKLSSKDLISLNLQIKSLINTNVKYNTQITDYQKQLAKLEHQLKVLEMQVPVHYLYNDSNIIYGFGKTFDIDNKETNVYRLILITDAYENTIFFSYEDLFDNKIKSIKDSKDKVIVFDYEAGILKSITDARDRKVVFDFSSEKMHKITNSDGFNSYYYFSDNKIISILNDNGLGAKFTYNDEKVACIDSLSALSKVENSKMILKEGVVLSDISNFDPLKIKNQKVSFLYNNYKSTTVSNEKNKDLTYLFDKDGKVRCVYENNFVETDETLHTNATQFNYQDKNKSEKISQLNYSTNYLSDKSFSSASTSTMFGLYAGDCICSNDAIPYNYAVTTQIHKIEEGSLTKQDSVLITNVQNLLSNSCMHKIFILSGWAKADSAFVITDEDAATFPAYIKKRKFEIRAELTYADETEKTIFQKSFDWRNTAWQYCALPITIDSTKTLQKIECFIDYSNNTGSIIFSNLELKEGTFERVEFDAQNRPYRKITAHSDWEISYTYENEKTSSPCKQIVKNVATEAEYVTTYAYNKQGSPLRTTDHNGIVQEKVYNDKGLVEKTVTYHITEPSSKFTQENKLDDKGNVKSELNDRGKEVYALEYIDGTGIVSSQTDKHGNKISFGYAQDDTPLESTTSVDGISNTNTFGYELDFLTILKHNNFEIGYDYDGNGRTSKIAVAGTEYLSKTYADNEETTLLGTNEKFRHKFNDDGKVLEIYHTPASSAEMPTPQETLIVQNIYNTYGQLVDSKDVVSAQEVKIYYDKFGNVDKEDSAQHGIKVVIENQYMQDHQNVECSVLSIGDEDFAYCYERDYTPDAKLKRITLPNGIEQSLDFDKLGRVKNLSTGTLSKEFEYLKFGDHATNLVSKLSFAKDGTKEASLAYRYDEKGNIIEIRECNALLARYKYDSLSRITREDNRVLGKTITFIYDAGGNILCKKEYAFSLIENLDIETEIKTDTYNYPISGWRDQLKSFNGEAFVYDALGNPSVYRNKALVWSHGRQLDKFADLAEYTYTTSGIRTSKIANGFTTKYFLSGNKILRQKDASNTIDFFYGADGVTGFHLKNSAVDADYLYMKNIQNDIIGIYSTDGTQIVRYTYDVWGNQRAEYLNENGNFVDIPDNFMYNNTSNINCFVAHKNPFRYRGYYYDFETGLYYLNSRYYDPELGRFINADSLEYLDPTNFNGLNLYAYCVNNPTNYDDISGHYPRQLNYQKLTQKNFKSTQNIKLFNTTKSLSKHIQFELEYSWTLLEWWLGYTIGNIIYTVSHSNESPDLFYSFSSVGTNSITKGVGYNFGNWFGQSFYYTTDFSVGMQQQLSPWVHYGLSIGLGGIGFNVGWNTGNTAHNISVNVGFSTMALVAVLLASPELIFSKIAAGFVLLWDLIF